MSAKRRICRCESERVTTKHTASAATKGLPVALNHSEGPAPSGPQRIGFSHHCGRHGGRPTCLGLGKSSQTCTIRRESQTSEAGTPPGEPARTESHRRSLSRRDRGTLKLEPRPVNASIRQRVDIRTIDVRKSLSLFPRSADSPRCGRWRPRKSRRSHGVPPACHSSGSC